MDEYTHVAQSAQDVVDVVETLPGEDIVHDDSDTPLDRDFTVLDGCSHARHATLTPAEERDRCTITTAWEMGALDAASAFEALRLAGLLDLNLIMGLYAGYVRGTARAEVL